jgi:hypothetical protein
MSKKFTIRGKTYDLDDAADLVSIQNALVPENWPGKRADGVRNFIATQEMLALQLRRHLAANFRIISKTAQEEVAEGGTGKVKVSFAFEIDQTSPMVVAITGLAMSFSVKHGTKGKPQTYDLTQGELPLEGEDMTSVFDTKTTESEADAKDDEEKKDDEKPATDKVEKFPGAANSEGDVTPETTPGDTPEPPKRGRGRPSKK